MRPQDGDGPGVNSDKRVSTCSTKGSGQPEQRRVLQPRLGAFLWIVRTQVPEGFAYSLPFDGAVIGKPIQVYR